VLEPFQLPFVQRGLHEVAILAIPAGILGTWIVLRGLASFSHAVGTAVLEATYGGAIVEIPGGGRAILPPHHHHH
jgi:ABC-type Mn2+/Zn2+ transport system permease subunit